MIAPRTRSGLDLGITPDGPKGPKEEIKEGAAELKLSLDAITLEAGALVA